MKILIIVLIALIVGLGVTFAGIQLAEKFQTFENCKIWITMNANTLTNEEYRNDFVGFRDYPRTTNEEYFKIRFLADNYECHRWFNYDKVLDDVLNERIDDNYFKIDVWSGI